MTKNSVIVTSFRNEIRTRGISSAKRMYQQFDRVYI